MGKPAGIKLKLKSNSRADRLDTHTYVSDRYIKPSEDLIPFLKHMYIHSVRGADIVLTHCGGKIGSLWKARQRQTAANEKAREEAQLRRFYERRSGSYGSR